jgi:hypothetical protein
MRVELMVKVFAGRAKAFLFASEIEMGDRDGQRKQSRDYQEP